MSVREFSSAPFSRWPKLLNLATGVLLGPVLALVNQAAIYAIDSWACGHGTRWPLHVVPALCVVALCGTAVSARANWDAVGRGVEDERGGVDARTRFLALIGMAISVFSMIVVLAQWFAIVMFDPCMRA